MKWTDKDNRSTASAGPLKVVLLQSPISSLDLYAPGSKWVRSFDLGVTINGGWVLRIELRASSRTVAKRKATLHTMELLRSIVSGL